MSKIGIDDEAQLIAAGIEPDIAQMIGYVSAQVVNPESWIEARTAIRIHWRNDFLSWLGQARASWVRSVSPRYQRLLDAVNEPEATEGQKSVTIFKAEITTSPWYTYDQRLSQYRNQVNGRFVSFRTIYMLLDRIGTGHIDTLVRLSNQMHEGAMTPTAWLLAMQNELVRAHVESAALSVGGWNNLEPKDFRRIDETIRGELDRLESFGVELRAGRIVSEAQLRNRLRMYLGTARTQFYQAYRPPKLKRGEVVIERRDLGEADHCSLCLYLVMLGWQAYNTLPYPGQEVPWWEEDQCLSGCKCQLRRVVILEGQVATYITSPAQRSLKSIEMEELSRGD